MIRIGYIKEYFFLAKKKSGKTKSKKNQNIVLVF